MGGGRNAETRRVAVFGGLRLLSERASLKLVSWLCGEAEEATENDERPSRSVGMSWIRRGSDGRQQR
jgi:hypothetical protein